MELCRDRERVGGSGRDMGVSYMYLEHPHQCVEIE